MSSGTPPVRGVTGGRPARPRPSPVVPLALVLLAAGSAWAFIGIAPDWQRVARNINQIGKIISEFWPPDFAFFGETVDPVIQTIQMAILATAIGCLVALPIAFLASRVTAPSSTVYWTDRTILSVVRSIPDILYALIFVAALSIGPLPGILALIFFNIGVVAKLLSETVDGVDTGPVEAARASGASHWQMVSSSVLPQVLPNYVAYALYTFELNIRASAVLGFVGAGGAGLILDTQRKYFHYDRVAMIVLELFVLVVVIEFISFRLRRRLT